MAARSGKKDSKVLLVGDCEVGKTAILNRFKTGQFVDESASRNIFWDYDDSSKHISSEGKEATVRTSSMK